MLELLAAAVIAGFGALALIGHAALFQAVFLSSQPLEPADLPAVAQHG
jgi:hypothetical protein